jgi:hypothetical protein
MSVDFLLPIGLRDQNNVVHRNGSMRLALAIDEIDSLNNQKVKSNPAYLSIVLISKVLVKLGDFSPVHEGIIEQLPAADFIFLQDLYLEMNTGHGELHGIEELVETECPKCQFRFLLNLNILAFEKES